MYRNLRNIMYYGGDPPEQSKITKHKIAVRERAQTSKYFDGFFQRYFYKLMKKTHDNTSHHNNKSLKNSTNNCNLSKTHNFSLEFSFVIYNFFN